MLHWNTHSYSKCVLCYACCCSSHLLFALLQVLLVYGLAFMVILPVVVVSPGCCNTAVLLSCTFPSLILLCFSFCILGHMVVPLHPIQRRPDPHQHHPALYAFHVQDTQHEHEAWVSVCTPQLHSDSAHRADTATIKLIKGKHPDPRADHISSSACSFLIWEDF